MLTEKRKTTSANSLKSQKKYILNPGHNQQKKKLLQRVKEDSFRR